jgi:hypothetical protein
MCNNSVHQDLAPDNQHVAPRMLTTLLMPPEFGFCARYLYLPVDFPNGPYIADYPGDAVLEGLADIARRLITTKTDDEAGLLELLSGFLPESEERDVSNLPGLIRGVREFVDNVQRAVSKGPTDIHVRAVQAALDAMQKTFADERACREDPALNAMERRQPSTPAQRGTEDQRRAVYHVLKRVSSGDYASGFDLRRLVATWPPVSDDSYWWIEGRFLDEVDCVRNELADIDVVFFEKREVIGQTVRDIHNGVSLRAACVLLTQRAGVFGDDKRSRDNIGTALDWALRNQRS